MASALGDWNLYYYLLLLLPSAFMPQDVSIFDGSEFTPAG